jgi:type I site-specific restriction endonuclease
MNQMNAKDKKTIVFANSIEHAETINAALALDGYSSFCYHSKNNQNKAQEAIESFKTGQSISEGLLEASTPVKCIVSVSKISTGFDVKDIELVVLCRPTKVLSFARQIIGRGIRTAPNKEYVEILDLAGIVNKHGFHFEPYDPPKKGDKEALVKEKAKLEAPIIEHIVEDEPTEVTRELIVKKIEEIKRAEKTIPQMDMNTLTSMFEMTTNLEAIIHIGYEVHKRVLGSTYKENHIDWVATKWKEMINDFPQYKGRIFRTLKTRIKNIVKGQKKMHSLHYFPDWLRDQEPYNLNQTWEIEDEDIPF